MIPERPPIDKPIPPFPNPYDGLEPLTPDFEKLMERLDYQAAILGPELEARPRLLELINSARHAIRYASDAEEGNRILRERLSGYTDTARGSRDVWKSGHD